MVLKIPAFESLYIRSLRQEIFGQLAPVSEAFTLLFFTDLQGSELQCSHCEVGG